MKITAHNPVIEQSGSFKDSSFGIANTGMIFDILRNKMYSNPIAAICREYSCNARDTHRAAGKANLPIKIHLPNSLEPFFKVKDEGEGISPDRMENIFIKYAASTKREDNVQLGGFGLGSKTGFSYSDSFVISTNYDGVNYQYSAYIDETKVGKMTLLSTNQTNESNGTEIIIPVNPKDFKNFANELEKVIKYWDVKPIITGASLSSKSLETKVLLSGSNWKLINNNNDYYQNNESLLAIIDGIAYDLNKNDFYIKNNKPEVRGCILLYFNIGDLSISANRESLYLDDATKLFLSKTLDKFYEELYTKIKLEVDSCPDLWSALIKVENLQSLFYDSFAFNNVNYKNYNLSRNDRHKHLLINQKYDSYSYSYKSFCYIYYKSHNKGYKDYKFHLNLKNEKSYFFINDIGDLSKNKVYLKKLIEKYPDYDILQIVFLNEEVDMNDFMTNCIVKLNKLSDELPDLKLKNNKTAAKSKMIIFKYDRHSSKFVRSSLDSYNKDLNNKVYFHISKDQYNSKNYIVNMKNSKSNSFDIQEACFSYLNKINMSIYGFYSDVEPEKLKAFQGIIHAEDFIKKESLSFKDEALKYAALSEFNLQYKYKKIYDHFKNSSLAHEDTLLGKFIKEISNLEFFNSLSLKKDIQVKYTLYKIFHNKISESDITNWLKSNVDLSDLLSKIDKNYPLLFSLNFNNDAKLNEEILEYLNFKHQKMLNEQTTE